MNNFIFKLESVSCKKINVHKIQTATMFLLVDDMPDPLGTVTWNTGSYRGAETEVMHWLIDNKFVFTDNTYYLSNKEFKIYGI